MWMFNEESQWRKEKPHRYIITITITAIYWNTGDIFTWHKWDVYGQNLVSF